MWAGAPLRALLRLRDNSSRTGRPPTGCFRGKDEYRHPVFRSQNNLADAVPADEREIYAHMDDTLLRKTGKKVDGAKWMRDPLRPPFQANMVWGQRFMQISLSLSPRMEIIRTATVPVDLHHCPSVKKPGKDAVEQDCELFRGTQKKTKLSVAGAQRISALRKGLDLNNPRPYQSVQGHKMDPLCKNQFFRLHDYGEKTTKYKKHPGSCSL